MNKREFLDGLRVRLAGLSTEELEASLEFYAEAIDDRVESGLSEEEAVAEIGSLGEVSGQILSELSLPKLIRTRVASRGKWRVWQVVLLALGAPIWLPLLLAVLVCVLAGYVVLWAMVLSLSAVALSLAAVAVAGLVSMTQALLMGNQASAAMSTGIALMGAGGAMLLFPSLGCAARRCLRLSERVLRRVKNWFIRKEHEK